MMFHIQIIQEKIQKWNNSGINNNFLIYIRNIDNKELFTCYFKIKALADFLDLKFINDIL